MKFNLNFLFILLVLISCQIIMAATLRSLTQGTRRVNGASCDSNLECVSNKCQQLPDKYMKTCVA